MGLISKIIKYLKKKLRGIGKKQDKIEKKEPTALMAPTTLAEKRREKKTALCFEAGGMRCITGVVYINALEKLAEGMGERLCDKIDLFAGSGAGAVIAMMMADNLGYKELNTAVHLAAEDVFVENKSGFFSKSVENKYSSDAKKGYFEKIFKSKCIKDLKKDVLLLCFDKNDKKVVIIDKEHFGDMKLSDAAMLCTPEPGLYSAVNIEINDKKCQIISASHIASNPVLYAYDRLKSENTDVNIISLSAYKNPIELGSISSRKDWMSEKNPGENMMLTLYKHFRGYESKHALEMLGCKYTVIENQNAKRSLEDDAHSISDMEDLRKAAESVKIDESVF